MNNCPERSLIGLCLRDQNNFDRVVDRINVTHFTDATCAAIFQAMRKADTEFKRVSLSTVAGFLGEAERHAFTNIVSEAPLAQNVGYYLTEILNTNWLRQSHADLAKLSEAVFIRRPFEPIDAIMDAAERAYSTLISGPAMTGDDTTYVPEALNGWIEQVEKRVLNESPSGIETGFRGLDIVFNGGWERGSMYTIAARTGGGKTTFGITTSIAAALKGAKVLFGTVEMPAHDIITKLVSNQAHVRGGKYRSGQISADDMDKTAYSVKKLSTLPMWIDDSWRGDIEKFANSCRRTKRHHGLDLVILDYIGQARMPGGRFASRREEIAEISTRCKLDIAGALNVSVLVLAQLNRLAENFDVPGKEHIADADNIARDSDGVVIIYKTEQGGTFFNVDKNRWGKEVRFPVEADLACNAFRSADLNWETLEA